MPHNPLPAIPTAKANQTTSDAQTRRRADGARFVGINIGAETIKLVELQRTGGKLRWTRRELIEHHKEPDLCLHEALARWSWSGVAGAAVSGRLARQVRLPQVPAKQAQMLGYRFLFGQSPATLVSLGSHGFSVLELRPDGLEVFRENSRCSQGTGNFLRQLVERFSLTIEEASRLCTPVADPAVLSGRCPVILKTDMTHLANKGEDRARILAGLFDAVCENVLTLIKPELCPENVVLIGGVSRAPRVQATFQKRLKLLGMKLLKPEADDALYFEALGSAVVCADRTAEVPPLKDLHQPAAEAKLERVPSLTGWLGKVHRMPPQPLALIKETPVEIILGFDIGSTGSKAVALNPHSRELMWEGYRSTAGDPIGAAQALLQEYARGPAAKCPVVGFGVTGSGREIVGSLLTACYGKEPVFVLNEIAAHAEGARFFDERVDTIFEIGGQDAKYIRLAGGRVVDCAMNEACSAGTGSFIEEQGRKFAGIQSVAQLGREAIAAKEGVSLGQHCSVFMAEVIDEAVAAGVEQPTIIAGLYDSIIQNYLNRVKGSRSVGQVIFCQGMPFASDALAAAVARQTGGEVIVPPNPGTVGALGISLLARHEIKWAGIQGLDTNRFLEARVESKDMFRCKASVGCGGAGNHCRIDRLNTVVAGKKLGFTWGGGCALYDKGTRKKKLPDLAPDPFREREQAAQNAIMPFIADRGHPRVALTDEFSLKGLLPFFAAYIHELGFDLALSSGGDHADLKRGIQGANVPFCAPMQLFHGLSARMVEAKADFIFLPMMCSLPGSAAEKHAVTCPIVQASADLIRRDLASRHGTTVISPVIEFGPDGFNSGEFLTTCRQLARDLGVSDDTWRRAHATASKVQQRFEQDCRELGQKALQFCADHEIIAVVVLGRPYTIHNQVLNSNVPAILREQGAIGIPIDCYPVEESIPTFNDMYWAHGQRILRAAHQVRRTAGQYSLYCSNYACGPDSFNLHFYAHIMAGKPFAIVETDGHSGDAGTKTRVEAFLHCVEQDRQSHGAVTPAHDFREVQTETVSLKTILAQREKLLIPWMGTGSEVLAASFRGMNIPAESLPQPDRVSAKTGRRHTSGKECLPAILTLGSLVNRLEQAGPNDKFAYFMASTCGPCRFGVYNLLNQIVLQRLGWQDRVRIWSPRDTGYFDELPSGFAMLVFAGFMAADLLQEALLDVLPVETKTGAVREIYQRSLAKLLSLLEQRAPASRSASHSLWQVTSGRLFGIRDLLTRTAKEFTNVRGTTDLPTILVVGEIYVRCVPFANDSVIEKLQQHGFRAQLAPLHEWLEYCDHLQRRQTPWHALGQHLSDRIQDRISHAASQAMDTAMGWPGRPGSAKLLAASKPYMRDNLEGEAVLTLGNPLVAWRRGRIDGVLSVGPHECMPNKIAESQFFHITEDEGLPALTLSLNGEPLDPEALDSFAFEVHSRYKQKSRMAQTASTRAGSIRPGPEGNGTAPSSGIPAPRPSGDPFSTETESNETTASTLR